jgi:hypothetical protein
MAKHPTEFSHGNSNLDSFRQITEQNLKQSRVSVEEFLKVTQKAIDDLGSQTTAIYDHSLSVAEATISNMFDCGIKLVRVKKPQELAQVQFDFMSHQAQALADRTKEFNARFVLASNAVTEFARRHSKVS